MPQFRFENRLQKASSSGQDLDVAVRRLRAKIDDEFEQKLIHTVRGMGYKLEDESE